jgi:hypothetical protein
MVSRAHDYALIQGGGTPLVANFNVIVLVNIQAQIADLFPRKYATKWRSELDGNFHLIGIGNCVSRLYESRLLALA